MHEHKVILVAVDLTSLSGEIIDRARETAVAFDAEIVVAHVVHELKALFGIYMCEQPVSVLQGELHREGREKLARLAEASLAESGVRYRTALLRGTPWSEIVDCAVENRADLIVIGSHVAEKPVHKILGSTAERILRHAPCAVLVVPPGEGSGDRSTAQACT